jgi:hypothetical protein
MNPEIDGFDYQSLSSLKIAHRLSKSISHVCIAHLKLVSDFRLASAREAAIT